MWTNQVALFSVGGTFSEPHCEMEIRRRDNNPTPAIVGQLWPLLPTVNCYQLTFICSESSRNEMASVNCHRCTLKGNNVQRKSHVLFLLPSPPAGRLKPPEDARWGEKKEGKSSPEQIAENVFSGTTVENLTHQSHFGGGWATLSKRSPQSQILWQRAGNHKTFIHPTATPEANDSWILV